jgi:cell shape-determining protein MreC
MLFTWLMLAGSILIIAPTEWTSSFQLAFLRIFNWPLSIGENISLSARARGRVDDANAVPGEKYRALLNYCTSLEAQLRDERERLDKLTGLRERFPFGNAKLVEALVYPGSIDRAHGEISVDKGKESQLAKGQFVLADNSIIGTVSGVSAGGARVNLFTSPASNIPVEIAGTKRFMRGEGNNVAKIPMMKDKPKIGAEVMAAKSPGLLNAPIIVGRVARCERNAESAVLWDVIVEPVCDMERLNDVVVIVMNPEKQPN